MDKTLSDIRSRMAAISEELAQYLVASKSVEITSEKVATELFMGRIGLAEREHFEVAFLDTRHRLIAVERLFSGTIDGAEVQPRIVVQRALLLNAAAIIIAHNHPSGVAEPSAADRIITNRIADACKLLDIRVLDHIIVGKGESYSFALHGLI